MRLKKIRLAGFKSFVDPTNIPFPDDMTAIVGPNGCGKSNVIDAVRWVLGESSAKNLRGDAMTDVIFNGSSARKPVSQCSVELVFDNSSGRIQGEYANYNELSVKRLVTRDGQSNYFLNASKCRRRDVTDLFLGTGLGPRSYAIIEQGMISRLIESKPQELRVFIEEAAGISKYKERRRETENRIRHTKENLERLEDVRGELGQQLEKLQRQASAAKRYKELKARERSFKAELAALRWLRHSNKIEQLESSIRQQETDIEAFVAQQRGDEKGINLYREQQQDLKQQLTEVQQEFFKIGTDITRLEQNQIHARQRRQQIEQELRSLQDSISDIEESERQEQARIESLQQDIAENEPEQLLLEEQFEQSQIALTEAEDALAAHEKAWREKEQAFVQLKQQVQGKHSQIQATMNMQMRTQQRISELKQEQSELEHDLLAEQAASLELEVSEAKAHFEEARAALDKATSRQQGAHDNERNLEQLTLKYQGEVQRIDARISALQSLQDSASKSDVSAELDTLGIEHVPLWQSLEIEAGWENAFECVLQNWQRGRIVQADRVPEALMTQTDVQLIFAPNLTAEVDPDSLAARMHNDKVPQWLNHIFVAEDVAAGWAHKDQLAPGQSIITREGVWIGPDWLVTSASSGESGVLARAAQLREANEAIKKARQVLLENELALNAARQEMQQAKDNWQSVNDDCRQAEQALTQQQNQLNLLQMQLQQSINRQSRIGEELTRQQELLEQETLQSEELAVEVEELEQQLLALEASRDDMEQGKEQFIARVEQGRSHAEQIKSRSHQLALEMQAMRSQFQSLMEGRQRGQQSLEQMQSRRNLLQEENEQLGMPLEEQAEILEQMLEQRLVIENRQRDISDKLAEVEALLSNAEKGQQGIMDKIQQMRSGLESTRLECEGFKVRAKGVLEQLAEMQQPLKPVLETLPEDASEEIWQQELEKTVSAVSRLGAVNLAAVEEYEVQSERKRHLDEQNEDLTAALDTLESAIRKIDKETRSRFRDTYDRVNNDLKSLFPKVFGGGSAYLELTDDDLLETGVTIMARPPGKKNSTIHLLSGGEKALTALSLVFAIFRLNPAPFCLLDEVDAPLDDANVGRFCKLVSEMSKSVQFIYITHNKIAMEMATHLTGVTMAEPGVSRMVAVDVEEAVAIAQA